MNKKILLLLNNLVCVLFRVMKFLVAATCFVALSHASSPPATAATADIMGPIKLRALRLALLEPPVVCDAGNIAQYIDEFNREVREGGLDTASEPQKTINIILCQIANNKAVSTDSGTCGNIIEVGPKTELAEREIGKLVTAVTSIRGDLSAA